jgi:hypothetical protein
MPNPLQTEQTTVSCKPATSSQCPADEAAAFKASCLATFIALRAQALADAGVRVQRFRSTLPHLLAAARGQATLVSTALM